MRGFGLWVVIGGMVCLAGGTAMGPPEIDRLWNYEDPAGTEGKLRELLPAARAAGEPGYLVELLTQIGRTYSLRGKFKEAHATLDEAEKLLGAGKGLAGDGGTRLQGIRGRESRRSTAGCYGTICGYPASGPQAATARRARALLEVRGAVGSRPSAAGAPGWERAGFYWSWLQDDAIGIHGRAGSGPIGRRYVSWPYCRRGGLSAGAAGHGGASGPLSRIAVTTFAPRPAAAPIRDGSGVTARFLCGSSALPTTLGLPAGASHRGPPTGPAAPPGRFNANPPEGEPVSGRERLDYLERAARRRPCRAGGGVDPGRPVAGEGGAPGGRRGGAVHRR